ncbi:coat protein (coatomer) gamma [Arctopsyche grandis]|uniref:coat protein (coatomer) gamma n=1 Tax=Arctopsyche grandis TaxID=121162 RepID=UPI00406D7ADF
MSGRRDKKEEEEGGALGAWGAGGAGGAGGGAGGGGGGASDRAAVLQEARRFHESPVEARRCCVTLTRLLLLLNRGEPLSAREATDAFFAVTKLFQCGDVALRRLVYLAIRELSAAAEDVIIVTSSLTKDMTGSEDAYRAAAIRTLCRVTDASMLHALERYMKQAIVDRSPAVSSAALVSALHLATPPPLTSAAPNSAAPNSAHPYAPELVRRWANEAQEAINSENVMVQYHALGVLYHIRKSDRLAVTKLVAKLTRMSLKSPYAVCMLIRIVCKLLEEEDANGGSTDSPLFDFVESCLRHKSEMVIYEAAHAIVNLKRTTSRELAPAVSVLQLFCGSPKPTLRFAAVRTLNKVAMTHPAVVTACNLDLENLITDSNRSIATLAITTLLKTGAESSVDRLMKQIATFVSEISDEFKIVVIQAIRALCLKFPRKHSVLMSFLSSMLRDEGGLEYKASIADTIITIIEENSDAKETGLAHLCEFIEDCEHTSLAVRILHLLGKEGPKTKQPSRYIRFIYNRVILENANIRAAAVAAMSQFGAACPDLLPNIKVLLARCQMDSDDEVRDRATYYSSILESEEKSLINNFVVEIPQISIPVLERSLREHIQKDPNVPFDIKTVPIVTPKSLAEEATQRNSMEGMLITSSNLPKPQQISKEEAYAEKLNAIPGIASCGALFKTCETVELTESETEYTVKCIKHVYANHLILQFDCLNTMNDQILENVHVRLEMPEGYRLLKEITCEKLPYNQKGTVFSILQFPEDVASSAGVFGVTLKFIVKDCDPNTGVPDSEEGYSDEYILEDLEMTVSDQIQRVKKINFTAAWENSSAEGFVEVEDTYALTTVPTLQEAVKNIIQFLGLMPAEGSERVADGASVHTLLCAGFFRGGFDILVRSRLALSDGVTMQLTTRSPSPDIAELITSAIG